MGPPCDSCGSSIKRKRCDGSLMSHLVCAEDSCSSVCHQITACSGIQRADWGRSPWLCKTHNPSTPADNNHIDAPPTPLTPPCGSLCANPNCNKRVSKNPIQCTCCSKLFHQKKKCSGLPNRYAIKNARPNWKCKQCLSPTRPAEVTSTPHAANTVRTPLPPCYFCKPKKVRPGYLECKECGNPSHQKPECSGLDTRGALANAVENKDWTCRTCVNKNRPTDKPPTTSADISQKSEPKTASRIKRPLRILQWNSEGINTKLSELKVFLEEYKIDIALIQESKLTEKKASPSFKGYAVIRGDRKGAEHPGGGLLTLIKETIVFKENGHSQRDGVEMLSVSVHQSGKRWLSINNIYAPPRQGLDLSWIPVEENHIIAGDFNGHNPVWDEEQPSDPRGEHILDWMLDNGLECKNNPNDPTRLNPGTAGHSSPDVTFVSPSIAPKTKWTVVDETAMGSDHYPIIVEVKDSNVQTISTTPFRTRWRTKDVNWEEFRGAVEEAIPSDSSHLSLSSRIAVFSDILIEAGKVHVRKTKPSRSKFAMNPRIKGLIKTRNALRREVRTKRSEWIAARKEVREAQEEAKVEAWSNYVENLATDEDTSKVWRVIKSLDGSPTSSAPNEALCHNGKTITSNKAKADIFAKNYASVSSLTFSKEERNEIRNVKKALSSPCEEAPPVPFTMRELKKALSKMRRNGAPGADDIPPAFLKELGPKALGELLELFNICFVSSEIPQQWRHGIIIPLLKAGKPASEVDSYRPISLTSCVVKLLERMISNRLYTMAENGNWISDQQAGFRKGYCTEDQIIKLVQRISDGFQRKPMERTVIALLDYSKAYDRTWRERLLKKLMDLGVPMQYTRWIAAFLRTRTAEVMINGTMSKRVRMKQGLPQGSVLAPLLFVLFINDIMKDMPEDVCASLFADDSAVYATDQKLSRAQEKVQKGVSVIEEWSRDNKLDLNVKKSCMFFFSTDPHEASWRPTVFLRGSRMKFGEGEQERCPKFLGIRLDRTLCFSDHVNDVCESVVRRCRMLACLAGRAWGWKKKDLRRIYIAMMRSIMDSAAAAWQPFLMPSQFEKLEAAQNRCLRLITGQYQNTSREILRLEADIPSYRTHSNQLIATAYEKGKRLPRNHPRREAVDGPEPAVVHRTVRSSFRKQGEEITNELSTKDDPRKPLVVCFPEIWNEPERNWTVHTNETIKSDISEIKRLVESIDADVSIYTDGSCKDGTRNGGAAAVVTVGSFDDPQCLEIVKAKGDVHTSSYNEEWRALNLGIGWLEEATHVEHCAFLTDSLSLLQALDNDHPDTQCIRDRLQSACSRIDLLYVPGHKNIPGNELADTHAKAAAQLDGPPADEEITFATAKAVIRSEIVDQTIEHRLARQFYAEVSQERDHREIKSRRDGGLLAQLRAGHQKSLGYYKKLVDPNVSDICERCDSGEIDDTPHWFLRCSSTAAARQRIFGTIDISIAELGLAPAKTIELAKSTLSL